MLKKVKTRRGRPKLGRLIKKILKDEYGKRLGVRSWNTIATVKKKEKEEKNPAEKAWDTRRKNEEEDEAWRLEFLKSLDEMAKNRQTT